jgi:polysaccharide biosynthesis transport protein
VTMAKPCPNPRSNGQYEQPAGEPPKVARVPQLQGDASMNSFAVVNQQPFHNSQALQNFIRVLTKRAKWIIGSILICMLLSVVISLMTKPIYQATATIELNKESGGSLNLGLEDAAAQQLGAGGDLATDLQTETAILQGDSLALAVIQKLGLASRDAKDPERGMSLDDAPQMRARWLGGFKGNLKVKPVHATRLIQVIYESPDPRQAAQVANALIDSYKSQYLQSHYDATSEASEWLTKQLSALKANVEGSEKKVTDFEKETGIISFQTDSASGSGQGFHSVVIQKLDALNTALTMAEGNRIEKEAIYRLAKTGSGDVIVGLGNEPLAAQGNSMVFTQGGGISNLQTLQLQQTQLKMSLADASTAYGPNNRHLMELQTQIQALDQPIHEEIQQIVKRALTDLQLAQQTEDGVRSQFDRQQVAASKLNEKAVEFAVLSQEAFSRKKLYEDLYTKLQEANVSAGIKATNITIVDPARSQSAPIRPKPATYMAVGMLLGIFVGFATAYTVDGFDRTVSDPQEMEEITGRPVIGVIPDFRKPGRKHRAALRKGKPEGQGGEFAPKSIWMVKHPGSSAAEAFRALRTAIMLSRAKVWPKVILLTSCVPAEGKTTMSVNLAAAFAQHNKKVIIVEADMRRPRMMHVLDAPNDVGLSNVLTGMATWEEAIIHAVQLPTLDILPAGPQPPNPSEILGSTAFDELLLHLRTHYDFVLIDSPPALLVTDPVLISTKVDASIWVVSAGVATRPQLTRAAQLIELNGMPVIGLVVNRMSSAAGHGYGYGYDFDSYGSYYGKENRDDE